MTSAHPLPFSVSENPIPDPVFPASRDSNSFEGIVGQSPAMAAVFSRVRRIAPYYRTVLVSGETGTGKELIARALHRLSPVRHGHYVVLNCSAVVETLFESELFGHVRGSFTGAHSDKVGLFEFADGGTLFLDEIGDMPLSTQAKLLRSLQSREVQRVGALTGRQVDVRVIAATNKNLHAAVEARQFREDLYYRLSMVEIGLPPLRDRASDIAPLAARFLRQWADRFSKPVHEISGNAMEILLAHSWPGNVRELENAIGHACMMTPEPTAGVNDLPPYLLASSRPCARNGFDSCHLDRIPLPASLSEPAADLLEEFEYRLIQQALNDTRGNQMRAARLLKTTRDRLRYRMKKYGLDNHSDDQEETVNA
ncbi:MAG: sigma-54 dependent transcriptional regulator [Bryobacteraceae bacterium]